MIFVRRIYALLTPSERRRAGWLLGLMLIGMVMETLGVGVVIPAIALLMQRDLSSKYPAIAPLLHLLGNPSPGRLVVIGMVSLTGVYLVKTIFLAFLLWRQTRFSFDVQANLSYRLFKTYLRQPYSFHLQRNSAQLIRNAITEVSQFTGIVLLPGLVVVSEGLVVVGIVALLTVVEPIGATTVVAVLGLASWAFYHVTRTRLVRWGTARQHHDGLRIQHLQQGLGGAKDVKLLGRESDFLERYREHSVVSARVAQRQSVMSQLPRLWLELLGVTGITLLVLSMLAQGRSMERIIPALGLFAAAAFRLMPSMNRILGAVQGLRYGLPVVDVLHRELALGADEPSRVTAKSPDFSRRIEAADIGFHYPDVAAPALTGVSLRIERSETVGVIGPSGSGKSTLVDVLLGLLPPVSGRVLVDGQDIRLDLRAWQNQIGYVAQSVYLTDDTLRRNVAFGLPDAQIDDIAVQRAIKAAQLDEFVASLPAGLDTMVGERGVRLSGGQRQRIGIARALYHDPPVLVLDEATSALDVVTERGFMQAVAALHGSKTILIVAHRLSTVAQCDRIYQLEQGRVTAEGTAAEVLSTKRIASSSHSEFDLSR